MLKIQFKTYLIIVATLVIGLSLGYIWGSNQGLKQGREEIEQKYQAKIKELYPAPLEPEEFSSVDGKIKEIKDNFLILEVAIPAANPFEEPKTEIKTVGITDTTEFVKAVQKSQGEMARENETTLEAKKENPKLEVPIIEFYKEKSILFSDFKAGDTIIAEADENIKGKTEFTAKKIRLLIIPAKEQSNQPIK